MIFRLSALCALAFAVLAGLVWLSNGMPKRFPPEIAAYAAGSEDRNPRRAECFDIWPENGLCPVGSNKRRTDFLLWGDSHADSLMPGIAVAAEARGLRGEVFLHGGCPPFLGVVNEAREWAKDCVAYFEKISHMLQTRDDIDTVILVARWSTGFGLPAPEGGEPVRLRDYYASEFETSEQNFDIAARGLQRTIQEIHRSGREVVILSGLPEIGWDVPHALLKQARFSISLPPAPTLSSVRERNVRIEELFSSFVSEGSVRLVSLNDILCTPVCNVVLDDHPLYVDDDHISSYAARNLLAEPLGRRIWGDP